MRSIHWIVILICFVATCSVQASDPVHVPLGSVPILDGTLTPDEWVDALSISLNPDSTLFLKHAGGFLYLAVQATTMGVPSPLIIRDREVVVLHASAALGTGIYAQEDESWVLRQPFIWQCRSRSFSEAASAERSQFLETEGWLGTIGHMGTPTMFEYQIRLEDEPLRLLFLFMEVTTPLQLLSWPLPAESAAAYLEVITGPIPETAEFDPDSWSILLFAPETE
jgi:hypothetical protein